MFRSANGVEAHEMAGAKGRSGGHNRKSIAEHKANDTYRPGRHGREERECRPTLERVDKPSTLSPGAAAVWDALAPKAQAMGTLTSADVRSSFATFSIP